MIMRVLPLREEAVVMIYVGKLSVNQHSHFGVSVKLTFSQLLEVRLLTAIISKFDSFEVGSIRSIL
jgi:hypothetical protein